MAPKYSSFRWLAVAEQGHVDRRIRGASRRPVELKKRRRAQASCIAEDAEQQLLRLVGKLVQGEACEHAQPGVFRRLIDEVRKEFAGVTLHHPRRFVDRYTNCRCQSLL